MITMAMSWKAFTSASCLLLQLFRKKYSPFDITMHNEILEFNETEH
jgi:hypothetical protein